MTDSEKLVIVRVALQGIVGAEDKGEAEQMLRTIDAVGSLAGESGSPDVSSACATAKAGLVALIQTHDVASSGFGFGAALALLKMGKRVRRAGWNGKGMWLALSPGATRLEAARFWATPNKEWAAQQPEAVADVLPCITMKTADDKILMGWLASQTDMLSEDWELVED